MRGRRWWEKELTHSWTHTEASSEDVREFYMVDLSSLYISIDRGQLVSLSVYWQITSGENQNILTVSKQGWIRRAVAAGTTAIYILLRWHVYCKGWPRTDDHSTGHCRIPDIHTQKNKRDRRDGEGEGLNNDGDHHIWSRSRRLFWTMRMNTFN